MSYEFPLNDDAVAAADRRFYEENPGPPAHDENGNQVPLSAQNTGDHDLHEEWERLYHEELAKIEDREDSDDGGDDGNGGDYDGPPDDGEDLPDQVPGGGTCPKTEISMHLLCYELLPVETSVQVACEGVEYTALLTAGSVYPTSGDYKIHWTDIPPGNCEFYDFDYHKVGDDANSPEFKIP